MTILERTFRIACADDERDALLRAVDYLDQKMREIRAGGNVMGFDRVAAVAALNLTHELLTHRLGSFDIGEFQRRIQRMSASIDEAMSAQDKLF